jgi:hypothetical protein
MAVMEIDVSETVDSTFSAVTTTSSMRLFELSSSAATAPSENKTKQTLIVLTKTFIIIFP